MSMTLGGAALGSAAVGIAANAILPGRNATTDLGSRGNVSQYVAIGAGATVLGGVAPSLFGRATAADGAARGALLGASMLVGWAAGELLSRDLGI